jgi:hypothetical protein
VTENTGVKEMYMDGGYYSEELASNQKVEIHFSDMTGRAPSEDKIAVTEYRIDPEKDVISECPAKIVPISTIKNDENYVAHFDKNICKNCSLFSKCRILEQVKSTVLRISVKSLEAATRY